ncbi:hypothetical protein LZ023_37895 (plasmid) [Pseudomonas silvicola]|nr:hypothetical protein LZ023_37895 [Pseudomonas silvicola]
MGRFRAATGSGQRLLKRASLKPAQSVKILPSINSSCQAFMAMIGTGEPYALHHPAFRINDDTKLPSRYPIIWLWQH